MKKIIQCGSFSVLFVPWLGGVVHASEDLFLEEVLVTARKQAETIQDVPLSITAINAAEIGIQAIEKTEDLVKLSPGLTFTKGIGGQDVRPDIRGVTPLSGRANVAILVDGIDITSDALIGTGAGQLTALGLYDLERVEVVRGPQSALFGRNAFGGAISYITKKPTASFEGTLSAEVASYDTRKGKIGISGPITDSVLYRLNMAYSRNDGQYKDELNGREYGGERTKAASLALQFLPTESLEILTRMDWSDQQADLPAKGTIRATRCVDTQLTTTAVEVPCTDGNGNPTPNARLANIGTVSDSDELFIAASDDEFLGLSTKLWQFTTLVDWYFAEDYSFTSNTSYIRMEGTDDFDLDHLPTVTAVVGNASQGAFPWVNADNPFNVHEDSDFDRDVLFQDFRLSFDNLGAIRWLAGVEFFKEDYQADNYQRANGSVERNSGGEERFGNIGFDPNIGNFGAFVFDTVTIDLPINQERKTTAYGIYGSVDWQFVEGWELSLSARYQYEKYEGELDAVSPTAFVPTRASNLVDFGSDFPAVLEYEDEFTAFNPRMVLTHFVSDSAMIFGSISKGTKPGGFSADIELSPASQRYDQEELVAYELGWKTSWMRDRVFVNGALFYNDNTDKQVQTIDYNTVTGIPRSYTGNIGEAASYGLELQVTGVISTGWTASLNYAFTQTDIKEYLFSSASGIPTPLPRLLDNRPPEEKLAETLSDPDADQSGNELPYTPEHSLNLSTNYTFSLSDSVDAFIRIDYRYMSERWVSTNNLAKMDDYDIWDIKFGINHASYEVVAYVDNVADDDTVSSVTNFSNFIESFSRMTVGYPARKRTAGVRLKYYF